MFASHQCAVCWQSMETHEAWYEHARAKHGAILDEFGFRDCRGSRVCPGTQRGRIKQGTPAARRPRPEPATFVARDGTTYTPSRLPGL